MRSLDWWRDRAAHLLAALACCWFGYWSAETTYVRYIARYSSPSAQETAIKRASGDADLYANLAKMDPAQAMQAMQKAVELNPNDSSLWIQYGRAAEEHKDFPRAEACLLRAVRLDKTFAPRWSLAELYFRTHDSTHFWPAMNSALVSSYDDITPLFGEAWQLTSDADLILSVIPDRPDVLTQYLNYLVNEKRRVDLALPVAIRLAGRADAGSAPALLNICDRLLEGGRAEDAAGIWNALSRSKLVPYPPLNPQKGAILTNSKLLQPFLASGFDWRAQVP